MSAISAVSPMVVSSAKATKFARGTRVQQVQSSAVLNFNQHTKQTLQAPVHGGNCYT